MSRGIQNQIVNIFRSSLALGYIPEDWRTARVVFMPKVGKNDLRRTPQPKITWDCITSQGSSTRLPSTGSLDTQKSLAAPAIP